MNNPITIETTIDAPIEKVWEYWTEPEHIMKWNHASDDWHTVSASNDVRVGGLYAYRMESKDGKEGFDMKGTYTEVDEYEKLAYEGGGRKIEVEFVPEGEMIKVIESFEPEDINPREAQEEGWQSILNNFKNYVEEN